MSQRIGILGGTFDPPHVGHMLVAEYVRVEAQLDEVWFLPSYAPPHKDQAKADSASRLDMLKHAIITNHHFQVCDIEHTRKGISYTYDTMRELKQRYAANEFSFIIGGDMVEYLPKWYKIEELRQIVDFIGVRRPGFDWSPAYNVEPVIIPAIDISSSMIRKRIQEGKSIRYLVTDEVYHVIKERGLYGMDS